MSLEGEYCGVYRLHKLLKKGNKYELYLAESSEQPGWFTVAALSVDVLLSSDPRKSKYIIEAFRREVTLVASMSHPHLSPLLSYGEARLKDNRYCYLVHPYYADGTLEDYQQRGDKLLDMESVKCIIGQLADVLQFLHNQHFIHGKVSPSQIAVQSSDNQHIYTVRLDGLALTRCMNALYSASAIRGEPRYLAPEQWRAQSNVRSDQYALGVLAYKLFTGHAPFQGTLEQIELQHRNGELQPASMINPLLPLEVNDVLSRALATDPRQRYASITTFSQSLRSACESKQPVGSNTWERNPAPAQKSSLAALFLLYLLTIGIGGGLAGVLLNAFHLLPASIATVGTALGVFLTFVAGIWVLFERLFEKIWSHAYRIPVIVIGFLTIIALVFSGVYLTLNNSSLDPYLHQGQLVWSDPLSNNTLAHTWFTGQNANGGECEFSQGTYHAWQSANNSTSAKPWTQPCMSLNTNGEFSNFVYEVQMMVISGDCGGVFFRDNLIAESGYTFRICKNGSFNLMKFENGKENATTGSLDNGTASLDFRTWITIATVAQGNTLTIYVNKQEVATAQDQSFTHGHIGVAAISLSNPTEVTFRDIKVWSLDNQNNLFPLTF